MLLDSLELLALAVLGSNEGDEPSALERYEEEVRRTTRRTRGVVDGRDRFGSDRADSPARAA